MKLDDGELWQTLGPYGLSFAVEIVNDYLRAGICSWIEDVKINQ